MFKALGLPFWVLFVSSIILIFIPLSSLESIPPDTKEKLSACLPIIFSLSMCLLYWRLLKKDLDNNLFDSPYPTAMVAQGTFYTFLGVCLLLYSYDPNNGASDIPDLLGGLKLAFASTVIGLGSSIAAKSYIRYKYNQYADPKSSSKYITINHLYNKLDELVNLQSSIAKNYNDTLTNMINNNREDLKNFFYSMNDYQESFFYGLREENDKLLNNQKQLNIECIKQLQYMRSMYEVLNTISNKFSDINNILASFNDNSDEMMEHYRELLETQAELSMYLSKVSDDIKSLNLNDNIKQMLQLNKTFEFAAERIEIAKNNIVAQDNIISKEAEKITKQYAALNEYIMKENRTYNTAMIDGQTKYIENLNACLEASIESINLMVNTLTTKSKIIKNNLE